MPRSLSDGNITYTNIPSLNVPTTLPLYIFSGQKNPQEVLTRLTTFFEVVGTPQEVNGAKGKYIIINSGSKSLVYAEQTHTFSFTDSDYSSGFINTEIGLFKDQAAEKIKTLNLFPSPYAYALKEQKFFAPEGPSPNEMSSPASATIIQLDYQVTLDNIPLFVNNADAPIFYIRFDNNMKLTQAQGYILPDTSKSSELMSVLDFNLATQRLVSNEGSLTNLSINTPQKSFLPGDTPKEININNIQLGYMLLPNRLELVPVYVFRGQGILPSNNEVVTTTTVVSAVP